MRVLTPIAAEAAPLRAGCDLGNFRVRPGMRFVVKSAKEKATTGCGFPDLLYLNHLALVCAASRGFAAGAEVCFKILEFVAARWAPFVRILPLESQAPPV